MGWTSGSFGLRDWTARSTSSISEQFPWSSTGRTQVSFPTTSCILMASQTQGQNLLMQYCPKIPQLMGRHLHLWSSTSQPTAQIPHISHFWFAFPGFNHQYYVYQDKLSPSIYNRERLWTEYLKLTQFVLNRRLKSKLLCNETFLIFKEQISGVSGKTVTKPTRAKSLEKYCWKDFECSS